MLLAVLYSIFLCMIIEKGLTLSLSLLFHGFGLAVKVDSLRNTSTLVRVASRITAMFLWVSIPFGLLTRRENGKNLLSECFSSLFFGHGNSLLNVMNSCKVVVLRTALITLILINTHVSDYVDITPL